MKAAAVAVNVPLTEPVGMVREGGTVRLEVLEPRPTTPPPDPSRVTVQVLAALGARLPGVHVIAVMPVTAVTLTTPPVPVTAISSPASEAPRVLPIATGRLLPASVSDRVAITPSEIGFEFRPQATHV